MRKRSRLRSFLNLICYSGRTQLLDVLYWFVFVWINEKAIQEMMMAWIWMGCACGEQNIKKERFYTSQLLVIEVFQCLIVWMVFRNNTICTQTQWQKAIFIILVSLSVERVNVLVRNAHKQDFSSFCSWLVVKGINHDLPLFTTRDIIHSIQHNQLHSLS